MPPRYNRVNRVRIARAKIGGSTTRLRRPGTVVTNLAFFIRNTPTLESRYRLGGGGDLCCSTCRWQNLAIRFLFFYLLTDENTHIFPHGRRSTIVATAS